MFEKKVTNKINKNIPKYCYKMFAAIFLGRMLSMPKNINNITKNKW